MSILVNACGCVNHQTIQAARDAAGRIMDDPRSFRVSHRHPCPICGSGSWCCHDEGTGITLCPREPNGALLDDDFRPIRTGPYGFLHAQDPSQLSITPLPPRERKPIDRMPKPAITATLARLKAKRQPGLLGVLAGRIGLPGSALAAIGCEAEAALLYTPERGAAGRVIGYQTRAINGKKRNRGRRGLIYADGWRQQATDAGFVLLPEGGSDIAACIAMGLPAVGRPFNTGGVHLLAALLADLSAAVRIIVIGERDEHDGRWPGRDGALSTAESLTKRLGRPVEATFVPDEAKDTRAWFIAQQPVLDDQAWLRNLGRWFVSGLVPIDSVKTGSPCGLVADRLACPDSHALPEHTVRRNRDNAILPQYIRNASAKYDNNPWDCPRCFGVAGEFRQSPALSPACCRKRDCPVCGPRWRQVTFERFAYHIDQHDGSVFVDCVDDVEWPAILKAMRREAMARGMPLRFVTVRDNEEYLTVISSVPPTRFAQGSDKAAAVDALQKAVDTADMGPRSFSACRAWGKVDFEAEPEEKPKRVPGGCSQKAFAETLRAWKAEPLGNKSFIIKCNVAGLFRDRATGETDAAMRADFWREAELYDFSGPAAAAEFRELAATKRRQQEQAIPDSRLGAAEQLPVVTHLEDYQNAFQ
jgi:hypothetical protein